VPVLDPALAQTICDEIVDAYVHDNVKARTLNPDGTYSRPAPAAGEPRVDVQQIFLRRYEAV